MTKYISLGSDCSVGLKLKKLGLSGATLFFDYLITANMTVVNNILSSDIRELVNINKLKILSSTEKNSKFTFYGIEHITGVHDLPVNPTPCEINMVIEKYYRRFDRIIEIIKSTSKIVFIRNNHNSPKTMTELERDNFIKIVKSINPNCDFTLVSLVSDLTNPNDITFKTDNYYHMNLAPFHDGNNGNRISYQYYDWFKIIEHISAMLCSKN